MEKLWMAGIFICFSLLGALIFSLVSKNYAKLSSKKEFSDSIEKRSAAEILKAEGSLRFAESCEFNLPKEDFFENEKNEEMTVDELLAGLSEEEAEALLEELDKIFGGKQ